MRRNCGIVLVRRVAPEELQLVYEVERESFEEPYPFWYLKALYSISGGMFLGGFASDGGLVGYVAVLRRRGGVCHVASLAVRPRCRGLGNGHVLLASAEEVCAELGCVGVMLEVDAYNWIAYKLYTAHGYMCAALLPDYYGAGRPGVLLVKPLKG